MLGPRLIGRGGVELRAPTLEDQVKNLEWVAQPEATRFWAPRYGEWTRENAEERFKRMAESQDSINWAIAYQGETVGFTGLFQIDWVRRDGESGLFIGRHDLYGRGIASEAVRLRTRFAWSHLRLHRVHNWIALQNRGSRRANEKAGYRQIGLIERDAFRSGEWIDDWMGEVFPERVFTPGRTVLIGWPRPKRAATRAFHAITRVRHSSRDRAELRRHNKKGGSFTSELL